MKQTIRIEIETDGERCGCFMREVTIIGEVAFCPPFQSYLDCEDGIFKRCQKCLDATGYNNHQAPAEAPGSTKRPKR